MRQAYAGSNYRVRHVQSAVHDAHLPFTGMQLKVFVREPSEDVPQCRDTYPGKNGKRYEVIPIHAPAWGATQIRIESMDGLIVSIHAPAWGATCSSTASTCLRWTFQSTRPRGARPLPESWRMLRTWFQSTRPRGARRRMWALSMPTPCFNPRARVGRDG